MTPAGTRVLVTGGTGYLGRAVVPRLLGGGYTVRVQSRRPRPPATPAAAEWATADPATGAGLDACPDHAAGGLTWEDRVRRHYPRPGAHGGGRIDDEGSPLAEKAC